MAISDEMQKQHETRVTALVQELSGRSGESDVALMRALIHRAVHLAADKRAAEFCTLATYFAEMITHAHDILHGRDNKASLHADVLH